MKWQEKQEEGVKNQFVESIADAKERIKKSQGILGLDHAEVTFSMIRFDYIILVLGKYVRRQETAF